MSFKFTKVIYKDIFSYFKYERVLSLCQKSKRFQRYIDFSLLEYKLFFYLSKLQKLYLFKAQNIQLIYELLIQYNDNNLESINKVFDFYIKEKAEGENLPLLFYRQNLLYLQPYNYQAAQK